MPKKNDNQESAAINIFDKEGNIRTKEEFLKDVEDFYNEVVEESKHECECHCEDFEGSVLDEIANIENQVDIDAILNTHDFHSRTIFLDDDITPELGTYVVKLIRLWNFADVMDKVPEDDRLPIKIYINTDGGDIGATLSIIGAIQLSKTPVYTVTYGNGYSGGFFIGICGHKRFCYPHSAFLFHEGSTGDIGDAHKFLQHVDFYKSQLKILKEITLSHTKITPKEYGEHKKDDWFFTSQEAVQYGIIDKVLTADNSLTIDTSEEVETDAEEEE